MTVRKIKVGSLKTNCYLLSSGGEMLVIDPGAESKKIIQRVEEVKGNPVGIINTHSHYDHVGANKELKNHFKIEVLDSKDNLKIGDLNLKIIETPGHKNDCICIIGEDFSFTGDTIFKEVHGRVDLDEGSIKKMEKSLEKLSDNLEIGMTIYPGHGESFELKSKNLKNKYLKDA